MPKCPRCLNPVDDDCHCLDPHCGYRTRRDSLRPFWIIFGAVGLVHLVLLTRLGLPHVDQPAPLAFWLFAATCWLFVNTAVTVLLYVPYVFAFELEPDEYQEWITGAQALLRSIFTGGVAHPRPANTRRIHM
jgi:hypothetical protein